VQTGLAGKVVIVTAATANIGRGIALAFAAEGARVVITGRDPLAGERVAKLARDAGAADVLWRPADLTVHDEVAGLVADSLAAFGEVDVLVNTVGGNVAVTPFASSTPEQWQADLELNLMTMFRCTHQVLPTMLARASGRIINIGSTAGFIGDRHLAVYSAAKGGVHAFTRVLALELGMSGITVNAIAPYGTRSDDPYSDMSTGSRMHPEYGVFPRAMREDPERLLAIGRKTALPRSYARPPEIGAAAVYLASDQAAFVTGHTLQVDGGVCLV
jgi:2-hydroxycyclohexanecarboxyl-CoA dehydrogenase